MYTNDLEEKNISAPSTENRANGSQPLGVGVPPPLDSVDISSEGMKNTQSADNCMSIKSTDKDEEQILNSTVYSIIYSDAEIPLEKSNLFKNSRSEEEVKVSIDRPETQIARSATVRFQVEDPPSDSDEEASSRSNDVEIRIEEAQKAEETKNDEDKEGKSELDGNLNYLIAFKDIMKFTWGPSFITLFSVGEEFAISLFVSGNGAEQLAAKALGGSILHMVHALGGGFIAPTVPMMAREIGKKDMKKVASIFQVEMCNALLMAGGSSLVLLVGSPLLKLLQQPTTLADLARPYLLWNIPCVFFLFANTTCQKTLLLFRQNKVLLPITISQNLLNVFLAWAMIGGNLGFKTWGISGIGCARTITAGLTFLAQGAYLLKGKPMKKCHFLQIKELDRKEIAKKAAKYGGLMALLSLIDLMGMTLYMFLVGAYDSEKLASSEIVIKTTTLLLIPITGFYVSTNTLVNELVGAKRFKDARVLGHTGIMTHLLLPTFMLPLYATSPVWLTGLFIDVNDVENEVTVNAAKNLFLIYGFASLSSCVEAGFTAALQGLQDVKMSLIWDLFSLVTVGGLSAGTIALDFGIEGLTVVQIIVTVMILGPLAHRWWTRSNYETMKAAAEKVERKKAAEKSSEPIPEDLEAPSLGSRLWKAVCNRFYKIGRKCCPSLVTSKEPEPISLTTVTGSTDLESGDGESSVTIRRRLQQEQGDNRRQRAFAIKRLDKAVRYVAASYVAASVSDAARENRRIIYSGHRISALFQGGPSEPVGDDGVGRKRSQSIYHRRIVQPIKETVDYSVQAVGNVRLRTRTMRLGL